MPEKGLELHFKPNFKMEYSMSQEENIHLHFSTSVRDVPMLSPAPVYCPMRPGVCAKFQFSPPHQWNGRARASPGPAERGPQVTHICRIEMFRDYKEGKHNLHFP